ncbi:hypothetical protein PILCRDRAFT_10686 [Piloderma croceum F 1598]|uniref:CHAT domain-containing protein n=1 Tax=Piloderma croceum (strain F 1598) TaxID=765440 RepID=A0A0C3F2I8_PILCF|nr:hypothetical protein PILCRDRAFT_10686 [Piloderma croceum F 1598]
MRERRERVAEMRAKGTGNPVDINNAIKASRKAVAVYPKYHRDRPAALTGLSNAYHMRSDMTGELEDLNMAITYCQEAFDHFRPFARPEILDMNLGGLLGERFSRTSESGDLNKAIKLLRKAVELPVSHAQRPAACFNLALALYARSGELSELDNAVSLFRESLERWGPTHPDRSTALISIASALWNHFEIMGQMADLDNAIKSHREAQLLSIPDMERYKSLNNLAASLIARFNQTGQSEDLNEATKLYKKAHELLATSQYKQWNVLTNLANTYFLRSHKGDHSMELDKTIDLHCRARQLLLTSHTASESAFSQSTISSNLGLCLTARFRHLGQIADLEESVTLHKEALGLRPPPHPLRAIPLNNLADALSAQFRQFHRSRDFEESTNMYRQSLDTLPLDHPKKCPIFGNLGELQMEMYFHTRKPEYLTDAIESFRSALTCKFVPTLERFRVAQLWARNADKAEHLDIAVELLEQGRAVFWSQALRLRTPLDDLEVVAPELKQRLENISHVLHQGSLRDVSRSSNTPQEMVSMEQETEEYRCLDKTWFTVLAEIRKLKRFQDFFESLCAALVVSSSGVELIRLPELTLKDVENLVQALRSVTLSDLPPEATRIHVEALQSIIADSDASSAAYGVRIGRRAAGRTPNDTVQLVLERLWKSVVKPIMDFLDLKNSDSPPRLWWCPSGPFALLPIHAASLYDTRSDDNVSKYVVSSYIPTLGSLLVPPSPMADSFKMMVAIDNHTLPYSHEELRKIEGHVPRECLVRLGIEEAPALVDAFLSHFEVASIVHLACHGEQNMENPLDSCLFLKDGTLKISKIMEKPMPNASLAFLAACETAVGDVKLPDEAFHLAATMLFAGFRGTVGTLWSMADKDGPMVADIFYDHLFNANISSGTDTSSRCPDITEAARALHLAVAKLCAEGRPLMNWVPFIHVEM